MNAWPRVAKAIAVALALSAPVALADQSAPPASAVHAVHVDPPVPVTAVPEPATVLAVPPALRTALLQWVGNARTQDVRLQRLVEFMHAEDGLRMEYAHDATSTVGDAYLTRKANCLTFTLLTVALARELGLQAYGQEIDQVLSWYQQDNTIYRSNHVNAGVRVRAHRLTVDVASTAVIVRHMPKPIDDAHLLAMFYNNRAVELSARQQPKEAAAHIAVSLRLSPAYAANRSNAGVLHLREGDLAAAERDYLAALMLDPDFHPALINLVSVYEHTGNRARLAAYRARLERVQRRDPFHHFLAAMAHERRGEYALAAERYRKAIRLHRDEHRFHLALARVYLHLGDARRAGNALRHARRLDQDDRNHVLYQAKLDLLRRPR